MFDRMARRELKDKTANEMKEFFDEAVNKLLDEGQALENRMSDPRDLTKKITLSQEFKGESYGIFQGAIMLVNIPRPPYGIADLPSMPSQAKTVLSLSDQRRGQGGDEGRAQASGRLRAGLHSRRIQALAGLRRVLAIGVL